MSEVSQHSLIGINKITAL